MANSNATILVKPKSGDAGAQNTAVGYYDIAGAITGHATTGDTYTFPALWKAGTKLVGFLLTFPELDTNASPTGTAIVGTSDDDNGICTTFNVGLPAQAPANGMPIVIMGNGALLGTSATVDTDIIIEFTAALATSVTSGRVLAQAILEAN